MSLCLTAQSLRSCSGATSRHVLITQSNKQRRTCVYVYAEPSCISQTTNSAPWKETRRNGRKGVENIRLKRKQGTKRVFTLARAAARDVHWHSANTAHTYSRLLTATWADCWAPSRRRCRRRRPTHRVRPPAAAPWRAGASRAQTLRRASSSTIGRARPRTPVPVDSFGSSKLKQGTTHT